MAAIERTKKLRLIVLDACRDNPLVQRMRRTVTTRSAGRGLAHVEPEGATPLVGGTPAAVGDDGRRGGRCAPRMPGVV